MAMQQQRTQKRADGRGSHTEIAGGDQQPAQDDGALLPQEAVGDPSRREGEDVGAGGEQSVDRAGRGNVEAEAVLRRGGRHIQDEERADAVVAEALPHFGEEERGQPAGVAEEAAIGGSWQFVGGHSPDYRRLLQL